MMQNIFIVGATGVLGTHLVKAFVRHGKSVSVLMRPASMENPDKTALFRELGVRMIPGDLNDPESLKSACEGMDAVVSAAGGGQILLQKNLIDAAREMGVKRLMPSEFGVDPHCTGKGSCDLFDMKLQIQDYLIESGVPYTFFYTNGFMEYWVYSLGQLGHMAPPDEVEVYGDGTVRGAFITLHDIAEVTVRILDDARTENREVQVITNRISQNDLIDIWEEISGKKVRRIHVSAYDLNKRIDTSTGPESMMMRIFSQLHRCLWIRGEDLRHRKDVLQVQEMYPDYNFTTVREALEQIQTSSLVA